jgi:hypothetical protein
MKEEKCYSEVARLAFWDPMIHEIELLSNFNV